MSNQASGQPISPDLDDLLTRVFSSVRLSPEQRRRHLARLGLIDAAQLQTSRGPHQIAPTSHGSVGVGGQPVDINRRWPTLRQWVELVAAVVAILLVSGLLVLLFRGAPDRPKQQIGSPGTPVTNAQTEIGPSGRLYIVSHVLERRDGAIWFSGRVTAVDGASGEERYSVETAGNIDAILAPDGGRLYVASFGDNPGADGLIAIDAASGQVLWRTTVEDRVSWKFGYGPTAMTISPDGRRLYMAACDFSAPYFCLPNAHHWLLVIDTATGNEAGRIDAPGCLGAPYLSPDGRTLYLACQDGPTRIFDVETSHEIGRLGDGPLIAATTSADGRYFYGVQPIRVFDRSRIDAPYVYQVYRLNMNTRSVVMQADIPIQEEQPSRSLPLIAVSSDDSRLFVGVNRVGDEEQPAADRILVLDTQSLRTMGEMDSSTPITGQTLAAAPDGQSVVAVAVSSAVPQDVVRQSNVLWLRAGVDPSTIATLPNEEVLRVLAGPVPSDKQPQSSAPLTRRMFVVSHDGAPDDVGDGRVSAIDATTGETLYTIDAGSLVDAALADDGTRLYVISSSTTGDALAAYIAGTGEERWRVTLHGHVNPAENGGAPTIGLAQDGRSVYVLTSSATGRSLRWFDAGNGTPIGELAGLPDCPMQIQIPDNPEQIYVVCLGSGTVQILDVQSTTSLGSIQGLSGSVVGSAISPDRQHLYVITEYDSLYRVTVIDTLAGRVIERRDIVHLDRDPLHSLGLVALSPDGSRLFVGVGYERAGDAPFAEGVWVWDTATWESGGRLQSDPTITGYGLVALDSQFVVAIHNGDEESSVIDIGSSRDDVIITVDRETIVRVLGRP